MRFHACYYTAMTRPIIQEDRSGREKQKWKLRRGRAIGTQIRESDRRVLRFENPPIGSL